MIFQEEPILKVGILLSPKVKFELKGDFSSGTDDIIAGVYEADLIDNVILTPFATGKIIELFPKSNATFKLMNVVIGIGFHWEQKEDQEFEGGLTLLIENGKIRAINTVLLESYLCSVISSEMSAMNDLNLLKAHAIVSRSWILAQIDRQEKTESQTSVSASIDNKSGEIEIIKWYDREDHELFDVCADDHCQRYQGITKIISRNSQKAVNETRGMVLTYNDQICDARFSKCCGGISENFGNVWQPKEVPYLSAIRDTMPAEGLNYIETNDNYFISSPESFCNTTNPVVLSQVLIDFDQTTTDFYRWTISYSQEDLSALLKKKSGIDFGQIIDLVPVERGKSGRLIKLRIIGSNKTLTVGKELEIRKWLSESHLYSSAFIIEKKFDKETPVPSAFVLHGAGWGHGVGMCQIGAAVMSNMDYTAHQIVNHYFKGAMLKTIY